MAASTVRDEVDMMRRYPIAYLRRSSADARDPGDVSREVQEAAVRDLARKDGHNGDLVMFVDWSKSASESKATSRTAYADMLKRIEAGEVSHVYAYALDRLNRSLIMSARFAAACESNNVKIVTTREGEVRQDSPDQWLRWTILATFGDYELRQAKVRAAASLTHRQNRGDHIGRAGYGFKLERNEDGAIVEVPDPDRPLEPVLAAVREADSILGACKLLNERGVPVPQGPSAERRRSGHPIWHPTPLRKIVTRNAPELLPAAGPTGRRQPSRSSALSQLLLCHCSRALTPRVLTPEPARSGYRCTVGNRTGRAIHGPVWVGERALLPWVREEAGRLRSDVDEIQHDADPDARAKLEAERAYIIDIAIVAKLDKDELARRLAAVDEKVDNLDAAEAVVAIPTIDWSWPPEALNAALRSLFKSIQLGPDLRPVSAEWRVPEWRASDSTTSTFVNT